MARIDTGASSAPAPDNVNHRLQETRCLHV
jgi:hypothetical protein